MSALIGSLDKADKYQSGLSNEHVTPFSERALKIRSDVASVQQWRCQGDAPSTLYDALNSLADQFFDVLKGFADHIRSRLPGGEPLASVVQHMAALTSSHR
jgi:hypothetical protein